MFKAVAVLVLPGAAAAKWGRTRSFKLVMTRRTRQCTKLAAKVSYQAGLLTC